MPISLRKSPRRSVRGRGLQQIAEQATSQITTRGGFVIPRLPGNSLGLSTPGNHRGEERAEIGETVPGGQPGCFHVRPKWRRIGGPGAAGKKSRRARAPRGGGEAISTGVQMDSAASMARQPGGHKRQRLASMLAAAWAITSAPVSTARQASFRRCRRQFPRQLPIRAGSWWRTRDRDGHGIGGKGPTFTYRVSI